MGIEARDLPMMQAPFGSFNDDFLKGSTDMTIEENMVLNIELPTWRFGMGGLQ